MKHAANRRYTIDTIAGFAAAALFVVLLGTSVQAQISTTPFRQFQDVYTPISGGTLLANAGAAVSPLTSGSLDDGYWTVPLPFPFLYNTFNQNTIYVCTNGYVTFGSGSTSLTGAISGGQGSQGAIAGLSRDLDLRSGAPSPSLSYATSGSAPNRIFTIQWASIKTYPATTYPGDNINFQIRLYETSNRIDIVYGTFTTAATTTAQVGLRGSSTAMVNVSNRMVTSGVHTWPTAVAGTVSSSSCAYNPSLTPPSGWTFSWGCNIPGGSASMEIVDVNGAPQQYVYTPGTIYVKYSVSYPLATAYTIPVTLRFYRIGDPSGLPSGTANFDILKPAGVANGTAAVNINLTPAFYRVEAAYRMLNNCGTAEDYMLSTSMLALAPGTELCLVWPGDANDDGLVNYGDRKALNTYIRDANLSPTWLNGPARYRQEAATNPLAYFTWTAQPSLPWSTNMGCHMDTDGNGVINNLDYIAMKLNWAKMHGIVIKGGASFSTESFDMDQNYPNPFNPTTSIRYSAPERSQVRLAVHDATGRTVAVLVDGAIDAGVHTVNFDAGALASGQYIATVSMVGIESGLSFSKTITMTLQK